MKLLKGNPYFCNVDEKIKDYPYLNKDINCEILIVGGGINGIILNNFLCEKKNVVLVDKGRLAFTCTSCATALLEYQLDDFAEDLKNILSEEQIVKIYAMGKNSIEEINQIFKHTKNECDFNLKSSLVYSNKLLDIPKFKKEYEFRKKYGFKVQFIDKKNNPFPFDLKCGLFCEDGGAQFNPYLFCKQLIGMSSNQKNIFENTEIIEIQENDNKIIAKTIYGNQIMCDKIIIATGFSEDITPEKDLCEKFISYSIVTNQLDNVGLFDDTLIQDFYEPYHYLRLLPDKRIIFGGEDTPYNLTDEIDENLATKKYKKLEKCLLDLFPDLENKLQIEYKFCGVFGATENNLVLIGKSLKSDNILYFLSCGANGIINAMFGRHLINDILENKPNEFENLFSPKRLKK